MPSPKRWFAVSREINADAETWELEARYGSHAFRLWLEILSRLDETDNKLRIDASWVLMMSKRVRMSSRGVVGALLWMISKARWLNVLEDKQSDAPPDDITNAFWGLYHGFEGESPKATRGFREGRSILEALFNVHSTLKEESIQNSSAMNALKKYKDYPLIVQSMKNQRTLILKATKWAKYHKNREVTSKY